MIRFMQQYYSVNDLEDVDGLMGDGEFVSEGAVMVLQDRGVVVQHGQRVPRVTQERTVPT